MLFKPFMSFHLCFGENPLNAVFAEKLVTYLRASGRFVSLEKPIVLSILISAS